MDSTPLGPAGRRDTLVAIAIVALAVFLRAWHMGWGLPDFTEEAVPLQLALGMRSLAGGGWDWNPHAFNYPSLGVYLHLLVQACVYGAGKLANAWSNAADYQLAFYVNPTPMVLAARGLGIACDAASVLAAWRIGRRLSRSAGIVAALLVACSTTMIHTSRSIYVDSVMTALALWALERMLAWQATGRRGAFMLSAVLIGLAAGAKYPAAVLLLPLSFLALARDARTAWRSIAIATGIAAAAFLLTTPYALLDAAAFARDFSFEGQHAARGHLGSEQHRSFGYHLVNLVRDLGWPGMFALLLSPLAAWREPRLRPVAIALGLAVIAFSTPIALARIDAERYLLPVVATASALVAVSVGALLPRVAAVQRARWAPVAALALLLVAPLVTGFRAAREGAYDTQVEARRWCEAHVRPDDLLVSEGYGPRLADERSVADLRTRPAYALASAAWRERIERVPRFHVAALPLVVTGALTNEVGPPAGPSRTVEVAPHASAISGAYYEPALFGTADWFVTTSAVRGRYAADPARFAAACRLYRMLDESAEVAARFAPSGAGSGPEIVIYRIGEPARARLAAAGPLDPLWWTAAIPDEYRRAHAGGAGVPAPRSDAGQPAPWVRGLLPLYLKHIATFDYALAEELALVGHFEAAASVAAANHLMIPADVPSCLLASISLARTGRWSEARAVIERTLAATEPGPGDPSLTLQYARALSHTGEKTRARALAMRLVRELPQGDPIASAALADLGR